MSTTATEINRELLKQYIDAVNAKAERMDKPAASEPQIYKLMTLLQNPDVSKQNRINTYSALKSGASMRHAGVLIDKLLGTFGQYESQPAAVDYAEITGDEKLPWDLQDPATRAPPTLVQRGGGAFRLSSSFPITGTRANRLHPRC